MKLNSFEIAQLSNYKVGTYSTLIKVVLVLRVADHWIITAITRSGYNNPGVSSSNLAL